MSKENGWIKVRTSNGNLGYIKEKSNQNIVVSRNAQQNQKQIEGKVSLVWDYFSEYGSAPDRTGTKIKGVNVVSPTFFTLTDEGKGRIDENVGNDGTQYIKWATFEWYKVWPSISNNTYIQTTSDIMNDYKLRQILIGNIISLVKNIT